MQRRFVRRALSQGRQVQNVLREGFEAAQEGVPGEESEGVMSDKIKLPIRSFSVPGLDGVSFMAHHSIAHDGIEIKAAFTFYYVEQIAEPDMSDRALADAIPSAAKALREGITEALAKWEIGR